MNTSKNLILNNGKDITADILAAINERKSEDGGILLQKQYEKIDFVSGATAMAIYLNPGVHKTSTYNKRNLISPFGINASCKNCITKKEL